jgi:hypothetical protein
MVYFFGSKVPDVKELMRDFLNVDGASLNSKGEKALLPIQFLSCVRGTQGGDEVIHQGITSKSPKLITSGCLNPAQVSDYL